MSRLDFKRVKAIASKEFIQIWRDPRSLALAFAIPMLLLVLFGYALSLDIDNIPMAVWNQDGSQTSVNFLDNFKFWRDALERNPMHPVSRVVLPLYRRIFEGYARITADKDAQASSL